MQVQQRKHLWENCSRADINTANILMAAECTVLAAVFPDGISGRACVVHGISCEQLVNALNEYFAQKNA